MNIREAAAELDTTPKALRRLLRQQNGGAVVGLGGSYDLSRDQVNALRNKIGRAPVAAEPHPELNQSQGVNPRELRRLKQDKKYRAMVLRERDARARRLIARLHDPEVAEFSKAVRAKELAAADRRALFR